MTPPPESPQARLAVSRNALVRQMVRGDGCVGNDTPNGPDSSDYAQAGGGYEGADRSSVWHVFTQAAMAWWQHHPAQVAIQIGRPLLNSYAREKPLQLLGIAAGVGAAAVLVKPWRLVSATGLAAALLKSTKPSTALLSLLPGFRQQSQSNTPEKHNSPKKTHHEIATKEYDRSTDAG